MTLCRRVVIMLCLSDGVLHRTKKFVPDYRYTTALVGNRNADEVVVIDVTPVERRAENRSLFYAALQKYAQECYAPMTVGGGIRTIEEIRHLMRDCGADKVVIADRFIIRDLGSRIAHQFGRQALVAGVDYKDRDMTFMWQRVRHVAEYGMCGEILLNSIERDGSLLGYDLGMVEHVADAVTVPIMVAGGCGTWAHMGAAFEAGASAAATSVIHHLTETSLAACKKWLVANCKQPVREAA